MENEKHHVKKHDDVKGGKKTDTGSIIQYILIGVLVVLLLYNGIKLYENSNPGLSSKVATGIGTVSASDIMPAGVPDIYGPELGISYDDINANNPQSTEMVISKLASYENMSLDNATMQRYIRIGSSIACEYCCGAQTLVFSDGSRACGCAHSYAMRGLMKYLLVNHPEMSDLQILNEVGKWKVLFFPGPEQKKAEALIANGINYKSNQSLEYIYLASNLYRGIENQAPASSSTSSSSSSVSSGQVGNC